MKLADQTATPITKGTAPLTRKEAEEFMHEIPKWSLGDREIIREFRFKDFHEAVQFVNNVAEIVNEQDHHPDILVSYDKVRLTFSTHKINGLSMNDFIVAAIIDQLVDQQQTVKAA